MDIILISIPKTLVSRPPIIKIIVDLIEKTKNEKTKNKKTVDANKKIELTKEDLEKINKKFE